MIAEPVHPAVFQRITWVVSPALPLADVSLRYLGTSSDWVTYYDRKYSR